MKQADRIKKDLISWTKGNGYDIVIPNYYVDRYEMDLFRLTEAGFVIEYEIKISRTDFRADFSKECAGADKKHALMAAGKCRCNRFYFVVPTKIVKLNEVPAYAGLIYYRGNRGFEIIKNAPLIHNKKQPLTIYKDLAVSLSFREQILRNKLQELRRKLKK